MFNVWWFMKKRKVSYVGTTAQPLSVARGYLAAASAGNYALFGGGYDGSYRNTVDAYDDTLTKQSVTNMLSVARDSLAAASVGNYALFGGGQSGATTYSNAVDVYIFS